MDRLERATLELRSSPMVFLVIAVFSVAIIGCGAAGRGARSAPVAALGGPTRAGAKHLTARGPGGYIEGDEDDDEDLVNRYDDMRVRGYGHVAGPVERRAIAALLLRFHTAAAGADGAGVCSALDPSLSKTTDFAEIAEKAYPPAPSLPSLRGKTCARIMSLLFREARQQIDVHDAVGKVTAVRVKGGRGLALLAFRSAPERYIPLRGRGHSWKLLALASKEIP